MKTLFRLLIAALLPAIVQTASADIFVADGFLVSSNTQDLNQELLTSGRQTGTLFPVTYDGWALHHQVGNPGTDVGQPGGPTYKDYVLTALNGSFFVDLDIASLASGPLTNEFDMYQQSNSSTEWGACSLRKAGSNFPVAGAGEFGFLQRRNGGVQVFQNGGNFAPASWDTAGFTTSRHWKVIFSDTNGTGSAFNGHGSQVTLINGTTTLTNFTLGQQLNGRDLRLGFNASGGGFAGIDNLTISGTPAAPVGPNLSFEYDVITSGNIAAFTAWHRFVDPDLQGVVGGIGGDFGSEYPAPAEYTANSPMAAPADGNQFLFLNMNDDASHLGVLGGVYQDMGPMIPNHTYNLIVAIGSRKDRINSPGVIELVNGTNNLGTVLATTNALPDTQDTWQDYTLTYTTGHSVSGDLTICLGVVGASTIQANFDNVRLDPNTNAPPAPLLVQNTLPTYAETVIGDQVVFSAVFSNAPSATLQWLVITNGVTNIISGATTSTLTLNNVQTNSTGFYQLKAVNATNSTAVTYTTARQLVVGNTPAPVNNVIVKYAAQTFTGTDYFPAWPVDTNSLNLIAGFTSGSGEGTFAQVGDFTGGGNYCNADATVLTDGMATNITSLPNLAYVAGGTLISGAGQSVTYALVTNGAPYGLDLTNITVFGGWQDAGRDEQKYQVLYSTVQAPDSFAPLLTADYVPGEPNTQPVVSRTTLVPASGVLAHNVAVVKLNFNVSPQPKNGWEGYSEILVGGQPSTGFVPTLTNDVSPLTASDIVGGQIILKAGFSGATSLQWKKGGANVSGATSSTLTLNNVQLTDSGAYTLTASNAIGGNSTTACTVTVNPAPTPTNNIITAIATQTSDDSVFTPTWDASLLATSLFYNVPPSSSGDGDFTGGYFGSTYTGGSDPSVLTDGTYGTIDFNVTGLHAWVTCIGSGTGTGNSQGGNFVIYTLPNSPNGYNLTKLVTAGGWNDAGRDQQSYTVSYATAANPTYFTPLTVVSYNPVNPVGYSMSRATLTPASGVLASNVVALEFDMTTPAGENGFSGYSEIAAYGSPSATLPPAGLTITAEHQEYSTSWTAETPNLIANQLPTSQGPGVFTEEGCNVTNLTDGVIDFGANFGASCGDDGIAVPYIVFNADTGWDLTNIVVYTLWHDYGRDGQFYNISYSTWSAPTTFLPLTSVAYNPAVPHDGRASGNRVAIAPALSSSVLASNVAAVKFDFTPQGTLDFGWSGYTEIVLQGSTLALTKAPILGTPEFSGGNLVLTGTGGTPGAGYTWLTTTNLATPIIWTTNTTGTLDVNGAFTNSIPVGVTPASFFKLRLP